MGAVVAASRVGVMNSNDVAAQYGALDLSRAHESLRPHISKRPLRDLFLSDVRTQLLGWTHRTWVQHTGGYRARKWARRKPPPDADQYPTDDDDDDPGSDNDVDDDSGSDDDVDDDDGGLNRDHAKRAPVM